MKQIQSTDNMYPFRFFEIKPNPTHLKIGQQILQYISCVYAKFCVDWRSTYREIPVSKFIRGSPVTVPRKIMQFYFMILYWFERMSGLEFDWGCNRGWTRKKVIAWTWREPPGLLWSRTPRVWTLTTSSSSSTYIQSICDAELYCKELTYGR